MRAQLSLRHLNNTPWLWMATGWGLAGCLAVRRARTKKLHKTKRFRLKYQNRVYTTVAGRFSRFIDQIPGKGVVVRVSQQIGKVGRKLGKNLGIDKRRSQVRISLSFKHTCPSSGPLHDLCGVSAVYIKENGSWSWSWPPWRKRWQSWWAQRRQRRKQTQSPRQAPFERVWGGTSSS